MEGEDEMIVFENAGEIDPRLAMLIGVNVKESNNPIGYFGTGLKYVIACMSRWGEKITLQTGSAEYTFDVEDTEIRGKRFGVIAMVGRYDRAVLGFTTELGRSWEPWMVYRELWSNAHDEPEASVTEVTAMPSPKAGTTRIIVSGERIQVAHDHRSEFLLEGRDPKWVTPEIEIYEGPGTSIFYRGIAVQKLDKPSIYTYNILHPLWLTEDRTAGTWSTDPVIARGLSHVDEEIVVRSTVIAPSTAMEPRLDYDYAPDPGELWLKVAGELATSHPLQVPRSVRQKFTVKEIRTCPTCGQEINE